MMLTLYKGLNFDGVNSFPNITDQATFDTYLTGKEEYSQTITYNRIGDPILINTDYDTAVSYGYGCIDTGTKKYFIIPDSVTVNENNRVYLSYNVDWLTTLKYESEISFGRSHLIKSTDVDPLTYSQSIQPIDMRVTVDNPIQVYIDLSTPDQFDFYGQEIIIMYTDPDKAGTVKWAFSPMSNDNYYPYLSANKRGLIPKDIYNGDFLSVLNVPPDNILGVFFSPIAVHNYNHSSFTLLEYEYDTDKFLRAHTSDYTQLTGFGERRNILNPITTTSTKIGVITDPLGNIIYTVPYGRTVSKIEFSMMASLSQCYIRLEFNPDYTPYSQNAQNSSVLYACDRIDYISDAYKNWSFGMKGIEIEERRLQKNKALVSNLSNVGTTTALGMGAGGPAGAAVGAAGGLIGAISSYAIETYYESGVNALEDRKYQLAQDTMVPGSFIAPGSFHIIQLEAPPSDIARYNAELSNFGADCNLPVDSWTPAPGAFKFTDVEIIADVPYSIKQNIRNKLISGIKIVDVT
jgi:hypothetical protein